MANPPVPNRPVPDPALPGPAAPDSTTGSWFANHRAHNENPGSAPTIVYLSPEFGVSADLPQYSGGLGILAGDHLKAASDLGVPIVGVGLFYRAGYFKQSVGADARQHETFLDLSPADLGLHPTDLPPIEVPLGDINVRSTVWRQSVGDVSLYLLDTAVETPDGHHDSPLVDQRLYGGDNEARIRQEILLGVGGFRTVMALGYTPDVFHLNEGHAGFLVLDAIRHTMHTQHLDFADAVSAVRPHVVFTTHTPVPAGIDRFSRNLIETYLGWWCEACGVDIDELMELGHKPGDDPGVFNMAAMALRLAGRANGVSELHGDVSRHMFAPLWPNRSPHDVPIGSITNGVHVPTWVAGPQTELFNEYLEPGWQTGTLDNWEALDTIADARWWQVRTTQRHAMVDFVRQRATQRPQPADSQAHHSSELLDPDVLTIGFARRFATYKRATLLFEDPERLLALLTSVDTPVQFVFSGKAHPADDPGKDFIHRVATFSHDPAVAGRIVFVEDYDIDVGQAITSGVDVWLNTPVRPMEACGTSGMKALLNGALNCSVADGWWAEFATPDAGWVIPTADDTTDPTERDRIEAEAVFDLIEHHIIPAFSDRDPQGLPTRWISMMRRGVVDIGPHITAGRMVRQYVDDLYFPAGDAGH